MLRVWGLLRAPEAVYFKLLNVYPLNFPGTFSSKCLNYIILGTLQNVYVNMKYSGYFKHLEKQMETVL